MNFYDFTVIFFWYKQSFFSDVHNKENYMYSLSVKKKYANINFMW